VQESLPVQEPRAPLALPMTPEGRARSWRTKMGRRTQLRAALTSTAHERGGGTPSSCQLKPSERDLPAAVAIAVVDAGRPLAEDQHAVDKPLRVGLERLSVRWARSIPRQISDQTTTRFWFSSYGLPSRRLPLASSAASHRHHRPTGTSRVRMWRVAPRTLRRKAPVIDRGLRRVTSHDAASSPLRDRARLLPRASRVTFGHSSADIGLGPARTIWKTLGGERAPGGMRHVRAGERRLSIEWTERVRRARRPPPPSTSPRQRT
jgi:hypothetical protein